MKTAPFEAESYPLRLWSPQRSPKLAVRVSSRTHNRGRYPASATRGPTALSPSGANHPAVNRGPSMGFRMIFSLSVRRRVINNPLIDTNDKE